MNVRAETIKYLDENKAVNSLTLVIANFFVDLTPKARETEAKQTKETISILHSKRNYQQNDKATYRMEGDMSKPHTQ